MEFNYTPIILSLKVAFAAVIIVACIAIPIASLMAKREFLGKDIVESIITLPLVLPPSVVGFLLLFVFGKNGPIGKLLEQWFDIRVVFSLTGAVIAATVVSFPLMYQSVKAAIESVDKDLEKAAPFL
jgi:molybdate transport system permease protein